MLRLSPKPPAPTAFFSSRYRQSTFHGLLNSFNYCKCLKHIFARNALQRHQTRHQRHQARRTTRYTAFSLSAPRTWRTNTRASTSAQSGTEISNGPLGSLDNGKVLLADVARKKAHSESSFRVSSAVPSWRMLA